MQQEPVLSVQNLHTHFHTSRGEVRAVNGVSFDLEKGKVLGIVGESGCGKSVTALSILRILPGFSGKIVEGRILFNRRDLMDNSEEEMRRIRGNEIAIICQNPSTVLNPVFTIGNQLREVFSFHRGARQRTGREIDERILNLLREVHIPSPEVQLRNYPFRLSGGMIQRIVTAMGLLCEPQIIIADEPTTALDVTIQAGILKLLRTLRDKHGTSILFITHDFGVVARLCDSVAVMYAGRIVEYNDVKRLFRNPRHPYTRGLIRSIPIFGKKRERLFSMCGQPPDLTRLPKGCAFYSRCEDRKAICKEAYPPKASPDGKSFVHCWVTGGNVSDREGSGCS